MSAHSYPLLHRHAAFNTALGKECRHLTDELRNSVPRAELDRVQARLDEALFVLAHILEHGECASDCTVWWRAEQLIAKRAHPSGGGGR